MLLAIAAVVVFAADFYTKILALRHLQPEGWRRVPVIPGLFDLLLARNQGGAFSILDGRPMLIATFSIFAIAAILWWGLKLPRNVPSAHLAFGMLLGGAIGNLLDRFRYQAVIDFIHFYFVRNGKEYYWPTFNIADCGIVCGIGIFLYLSLFTKKLDAPSVAAVAREEPLPNADAGKSAEPLDRLPADVQP